MKQDTHTTRVQFRLEKDSETVYAYFPDEDYNNFGRVIKSCYAHIGQHSGCSEEYFNECLPATPAQYADLKEELESIGYNLKVIE